MKYRFLILLCSFISCTNARKENEFKKSKVIVIQPLGDFKTEQSQLVFTEIKTINLNVVLRPNISFPENSYYKPRNRYRADSIIKSIKDNIGKDSLIVGLSNHDISTTYKGVKDWGVMGLGYRPGKSCVVSDFRMSGKNRNQQFYKVVLHELGHTEGLPHCETKTCLMRDAEGGNHLDEEKEFCEKCKSFLVKKGWNLI
ncbi:MULTISPECIES: zinc-dependent metalloprotease family protein [unclassified Flavobacterium]|uniref:zinc-dependent metalloprotease family protein n=1 Tax=unclassified Flavobacterium TaxID=196869 RepID=UPI0012A7A0AC|nr:MULTISPECIES: zinc-dependent metalloprotease family protein [unclassified Flavobacterium]MBF4486469.1 Zn-dependent protease [Flavobacterium sp. CSZ]QGK72592.1 Zn-dependent protease [Flavobacterium sp. SLB02]